MGVTPQQTDNTETMNTKLVLLFAFVCAASGRVFLIDDEDFSAPRVRRDTGYAPAPPAYAPPAPAYGGHPGRVGPVYTFVKTDPQANFKWGVRHRVGAQYGRWEGSFDQSEKLQIQ